ncbi:hypothetical protein M0D21_01510 [Aquimarina sp. D1M17]|uniref:hypothetical protein n=1 Tax=Aquimarina acroporae TaxID=2937283 RepID=UPI0020BEC4FB|nr:hypothetical protein [Aquimarina acroporae]MCK8520221.1 hypothetical protein [Aquimarina acroporae]
MRSNSYFFKGGKGTYGSGHTQVTIDDLYINHQTPNFDPFQVLIRENNILRRKIENLQQTVFYNRVFITYNLLEDFSNSASYNTFPIYYNQINGVGRLLVDETKIKIDFRNTTIFIKDSSEGDSLRSGNRRFIVLGDPQPAYGNYVWYNCEYTPVVPYAYDNLNSFMPNNAVWFLAYQKEVSTENNANQVVGLDDLSDAQAPDQNVFIGTRETPDSTGETRGNRNVVIGKDAIVDGIGNDNVVLGNQAFGGLGNNGNNNSTNNVIIGSKAATDRVQGMNNVIVGGNAVQGDGSGSNNIVLGANVDIGGYNINNTLNIGNAIKGNLSSKEIEIEKLKLTALNGGSFNDQVLMISPNNEIQQLSLQELVNIKVYNFGGISQINITSDTNDTNEVSFRNTVAGAFNNRGLSRITIIGDYINFVASGNTGSVAPSSYKTEYFLDIQNGFFTSDTAGGNPTKTSLLGAIEDTSLTGIKDFTTVIETLSQLTTEPQNGWNTLTFEQKVTKNGIVETSKGGGVLRNADNTGTLIPAEAVLTPRIKLTLSYEDATNANGENQSLLFRRNNFATYIERIR